MASDFEDHCWKDVIPSDVLEVYARYHRKLFVGPSPALLAIDLYELVYQGGDKPVLEAIKADPSSCGEKAWAAIEPTKRLFTAARAAGIPVFYATGDTRLDSHPIPVNPAAKRGPDVTRETAMYAGRDPAMYAIRPEFKPQPGDVVIYKQQASAFFDTPLNTHLNQLGIRSLILCGESTSGCLRAAAVDAFSHGYHVTIVEECCFDRCDISHKVNLFDLHHKYSDVMHIEEVVQHLDGMAMRRAG
jgi:maleamate amidohydrolase